MKVFSIAAASLSMMYNPSIFSTAHGPFFVHLLQAKNTTFSASAVKRRKNQETKCWEKVGSIIPQSPKKTPSQRHRCPNKAPYFSALLPYYTFSTGFGHTLLFNSSYLLLSFLDSFALLLCFPSIPLPFV